MDSLVAPNVSVDRQLQTTAEEVSGQISDVMVTLEETVDRLVGNTPPRAITEDKANTCGTINTTIAILGDIHERLDCINNLISHLNKGVAITAS